MANELKVPTEDENDVANIDNESMGPKIKNCFKKKNFTIHRKNHEFMRKNYWNI